MMVNSTIKLIITYSFLLIQLRLYCCLKELVALILKRLAWRDVQSTSAMLCSHSAVNSYFIIIL